ncbi:hypothetical protein NC651_006344 [Populus alba x Populus x berolinensis]|nr:hypothetical protein NC651_006344 [Populus alba x Populus x berolinensis]
MKEKVKKREYESILIRRIACWKRGEVPRKLHQSRVKMGGLPLFIASISELIKENKVVVDFSVQMDLTIIMGPSSSSTII